MRSLLVRPNWDGLFPVPGDGRYEWTGFRRRDELPSEFDPARGYVVTANENNIPPNHAASGKGIGYEWSDAARAQRLGALLAAQDRFSLADSERMQTDTVSVPAQRVVRLMSGLHPEDARVAKAVEILRAWNGDEGRDSVAAAIFEVWLSKHLRAAVLKAALGEAAAQAAPGDPARVIQLLEQPARFLTAQRRDAVILTSLGSALDELTAARGPGMASGDGVASPPAAPSLAWPPSSRSRHPSSGHEAGTGGSCSADALAPAACRGNRRRQGPEPWPRRPCRRSR